MSALAVRGEPFTFSVKFLDADSEPALVDQAVVSIFYYPGGVFTPVVSNASLQEGSSATRDRHTYTLSIPEEIPFGSLIYAEMRARDIASGRFFYAEMQVSVIPPYSEATAPQQPARGGGLRARFVR